MDYKEANEALREGCPIECNGIVYRWINAIIWRVVRDKDGKISEKYVAAELLDFSGHSVTIARIEKIKRAK